MASQTSQRKSHVFRVTGLSRDLPDEDLQASLQKAINDDISDGERSHIKTEIAIVPSCYDPDRERVALVQFRGSVPQFLSELTSNPLGDWQVEMTDNDISFDCHFFGFTQLYTPDGKEPVVADIVAIAGLDGHAYGSWQGRGNLGRMWLHDFLSKDLPQCRTMIYGYNSKLSSHGVDTILDYGRELLEEIKKVRNTKELQQRPLFFIAHSFGGIILAHCLVRAIQTMEEDHPAITSLHRATYSMIFFGIPHKGLVVDDIQQMLAGDGNHPREKLLQQISNQSGLLVHQLADFKNLIRDRKVVSFYETEQTRRLVFDTESQRWRRTGDFITTVDADSALLQLPDHVEDKVPLHADHSMMVKFDTRNAAGYRTALDKLRQFAKDAPPVVAARFTQARPRPRPRSTVPFKKDPMFVGREDVIGAITEISAAIGQRHERVALVGLAGVGKTQIVIEYSHRLRESAPDMWIFWIHASNMARLEQSFHHIATVAEILGRDDPKTDIFQLVYQWLCDKSNGRWLMVLDNADDDSIFFSEHNPDERPPLMNYLPQVAQGSMLITSRNRLAARNLVGDGHVIEIQPMNEHESLTLLQAKIPDSQSTDETAEDERALVQALEYLPLAITQAGSYIANRSPRVTVSRYLKLFHESESNQAYLLQHRDAKDLRRDSSPAVITTWQLSFNQILYEQPSATDLLALMSMFDRQGIPEFLVRGNEDELEFEDTLAPLISYSLIQTGTKDQLFNMHRLVQLSVRTWLSIHHKLPRWQEKSRAIVSRKFPEAQYENRSQCRLLLAHAKEVLRSSLMTNNEDILNVATLQTNCGLYLMAEGGYEEAKVMLRQSLERYEKVLGLEHSSTLTGANNLGSVLSLKGEYEEAEAMHRRALEIQEKVLGPEHPDTIRSMDNLSTVLGRQGKFENTEAMHHRVIQAYEKIFGYWNSKTLSSIINFGETLTFHGKYEKAEAMYRLARDRCMLVLGSEHPQTITTLANLGAVLVKQEKHDEAEAVYRQALKAQEKVMGREHPHTLMIAGNIAQFLCRQGKFEEAEAMIREVLKGLEKVIGPMHPSTLGNLHNLAGVLSRQKKYEEAEELYRQALKVQEQVLGHEHPDTLMSLSKLGILLGTKKKFEEAEAMLRQAIEGQQKVLGSDYLDTAHNFQYFGVILFRQERYKEAEAAYQEAMTIYEKVLGNEHPTTLLNAFQLGVVLDKLGNYKGAEAMLQQTLEGQRRVLGSEHAQTIATLASLGHLLAEQEKNDEAELVYRQAVTAQEQVLGHEHPDLLTSLSNLGRLLGIKRKFKEAEAILQQAIKGQQKALGSDHLDTALNLHYLGFSLNMQEKFEEAEAVYQKAITAYEKILGNEHPNTLTNINNLGLVLHKLEKFEEAEAMFQRALAGRRKVLGPSHIDTITSMVCLAKIYRSRKRSNETEPLQMRVSETQKQMSEFTTLLNHTLANTTEFASRATRLAENINQLLRPHSPRASGIRSGHNETEDVRLSSSSGAGPGMSPLSLHSVRNDYLVVPSRGPSSTGLYLISNPLPADVSILEIRITSHDQGLCSDPTKGTWTWFEVSIIRPWCEEPGLDIVNLKQNAGVKSHPGDFGDLIQEQGWYFADIPALSARNSNAGCISRKILHNPVSRVWSSKRVTWSKAEPCGDFVSLLQEGDRLLVWARAQFPGWVNYVGEVQIALKPANSVDVQEEDTSLQIMDSSSVLQQGILSRNLFSTPHPLLQVSQRHRRSLGEKEDSDDD